MHTHRILVGAVMALAIGALAQPAVSGAEREWDVGQFDDCIEIPTRQYELGDISYDQWQQDSQACCIVSGGDWNAAAGKCEAPPATAQTAPQSPGEVVQAPSAGSAADGQTPSKPGGSYEVVPIGPGGGPTLYMP
ncbi:hypothetical protein [Mycobacterium hubeiense]|uniref:hypothetical protein n=1 Tax=Mycobacterium hubeiense TaxID=1867256 RepID=UPI00115B84C3|nr:hypothetical protein [Mycobacterium sp. QGD 101]